MAGKRKAGAGPTPVESEAPAARAAGRIKGRTLYIPDDLWERMIVQAHRRDVTISDYACRLLERHAPDHRIVGAVGPAAKPADEDGQDAA